MIKTPAFVAWHKLECAKRLGQLSNIESILDEQMRDANLKIEYIKS